MKIETLAIQDLNLYKNNARLHPKAQIELLVENIKRFGFTTPLLINEKNDVIAGHGRIEALLELGHTEAPCVRIEGLSEEEEKALRLADNQIALMSEWDMDLVLEELESLSMPLIDLTGFDRDMVLGPDDNDDVVPDLPEGEPRAKEGDVFKLGKHRLVVGDSTEKETYEKLLEGGATIDMVFTDPPYNVNYHGKGEKTERKILNDNMSDEAFDNFLADTFERIKENIKAGAGCYIFHSHKTASQFEKELRDAGFFIDTQLIWNKPSPGLGANDYRTKHEPFFYCYLDKEGRTFYGDRTHTTVLDFQKTDKELTAWAKKQKKLEASGKTTIWSMKRDNVNDYQHPTQKPVELITYALRNSSKRGDVVLDPFLGSGSTLIACEKMERACYGVELDPTFADVIIQRYVDFTGDEDIIRNGEQMIWKKSNQQEN